MTSSVALQGFVGTVLLVAAATLLLAGRRRREDLLLAAFLAVVSANFLLNGLSQAQHGNPLASDLAVVALALDPVILLGFVTVYPFEYRPRWVQVLLGAAAVLAIAVALALTIGPMAGSLLGLERATWHRVAVIELLVVYTAAWWLALGQAARAPTPQLAQRASWLVIAAGVALLPRLGLGHVDLGISLFPSAAEATGQAGWQAALPALGEVGTTLGIVLVVAGVSLLWLRGRRPEHPDPLARAGKTIALLVGVLALLQFATAYWYTLGGPRILWTTPFSLRWLVFSGILVYGILAYEIVPFNRTAVRVFAPVGGAILGLAVTLATVAIQAETTGSVTWTSAIALGLGASAPGAMATRGAVRKIQARTGGQTGMARRLELYRALVESAWVEGGPRPEMLTRLETERRALGLSFQEARTLEHVVAGDLAPTEEDLQIGEEPVPGVIVQGVIGEGSQARVYKACTYPDGQDAVIKAVRVDDHPREARKRMLDEFRALERLDHPNIVSLLGLHTTPGRYLLVMEAIDGDSLAERLQQGRLPASTVASIILQVLDGLESAHSHGILHRDLKPENILLDRRGTSYLADFGVAITSTDDQHVGEGTVTGLSQLQRLTGTLAYMAPEQAAGDPLDAATDLYQVGLVLYEMLVGQPAQRVQGLPLNQALTRLMAPSIDTSVVPEPWRAVVERALALDPSQRFQNAREMRRAILEGPLEPPA